MTVVKTEKLKTTVLHLIKDENCIPISLQCSTSYLFQRMWVPHALWSHLLARNFFPFISNIRALRELYFTNNATKTDLWPVVASCVCQVNDQAQLFPLLFNFLNEVTRRKSLCWMKVVIKTLRKNNIQWQTLNAGALCLVNGGRKYALLNLLMIILLGKKIKK